MVQTINIAIEQQAPGSSRHQIVLNNSVSFSLRIVLTILQKPESWQYSGLKYTVLPHIFKCNHALSR